MFQALLVRDAWAPGVLIPTGSSGGFESVHTDLVLRLPVKMVKV